jgi:hypothetical protein
MDSKLTNNVPKKIQKEMKRMMEQGMEVKADPSAIPDLDNLLSEIKKIIKDVESPQFVALKEKNKSEYEQVIVHKYLEKVPLKIINLMMEDNRYSHLSNLLDMFDKLNDVKKGKTNIDEAGKQFGEKMNEQYLYPKFGGGKKGFDEFLDKIKKENEEKEKKNNK